MAAKRKPGSRPGLVQCENCGEQYSETYRRCPFCDEYDEYGDDYEDEPSERPVPRRGGGKRLAPSNRRGGGYTKTSPLKVISVIISLIVILLALWIVCTKIWPLIQRGDVGTVDPNPDTSQSADPGPGASPDVSDDNPATSDSPTDTTEVSPPPSDSSAVDTGGATGLSLSKSEFSFSDRYPDPVTLTVTYTPAGTTGTVTWSSSDPDIVSVDENGTVSHGVKTGTATITAALSSGVTQTCMVHNQVSGSSTSSTGGSSEPVSTTYTVNNPDFTFYRAGETYQLKVNGYTGGVSWSSSNSGVATVSGDGTCTAVGNGKCTITGTLDNGATVTATVYVRI